MSEKENPFRKKSLLRRTLFILYLPIIISVQYLIALVSDITILIFPFWLIYSVILISVHASIIYSNCPFCGKELWEPPPVGFPRWNDLKKVRFRGYQCRHCKENLMKR